MKVRIVRTVPGYVDGQRAIVGETVTLPVGLALSLITDGYASAIGEAAVGKRETATALPNGETRAARGRPRKTAVPVV